MRPLLIFAVKALIPILIPISHNSFVYAQEKKAFDSLEIGLQYVANINRSAFHDFYQPGRGIEGFVEMPFYYGDITLAIQALSYSAKKNGPSQDFEGVFTHLKWGRQYALPYGMRWFTGIGVGMYAFVPDGPKLSDPYKVAHFTETELCAGLNSYVSYPIYSNWTFRFEGSYYHIFTYKRIDLVYFSTGMGYSFSTPKWLKGFLE